MFRNVQDAIAAFESGKEIDTIQLESEGSSQESLHELAFAMVKAAKKQLEFSLAAGDCEIVEFRGAIAEVVKDASNIYEYTPREIVSAESLAFLTLKHGWSRIVSRHHPLITLKKAPAQTASAR